MALGSLARALAYSPSLARSQSYQVWADAGEARLEFSAADLAEFEGTGRTGAASLEHFRRSRILVNDGGVGSGENPRPVAVTLSVSIAAPTFPWNASES